jgi:hypothetical protein
MNRACHKSFSVKTGSVFASGDAGTGDNSMSEDESKHPFIEGCYSYAMIVGIVVGAFCLYAHLFWQGGAIVAGSADFSLWPMAGRKTETDSVRRRDCAERGEEGRGK